jgi:hypothetical protein
LRTLKISKASNKPGAVPKGYFLFSAKKHKALSINFNTRWNLCGKFTFDTASINPAKCRIQNCLKPCMATAVLHDW